MNDLRRQLQKTLRGRVGVVGVGNVTCGDDGFGVRLAERLKSEIENPKTEANPEPEIRNSGAPGATPCERGGVSAARRTLPIRTEERRHSAEPPLWSGAFASPEPSRVAGSGWEIIVAALTPERHLSRLADGGFDNVLFLDAVELGAEAGAVVWLNSAEMAARFPQVSTHKLSLGLLARTIESSGKTRCWLLGVQPASLREGAGLSLRIQASLELLTDLLAEIAQTPSLLYRRLSVGRPSEPPSVCGLEIRDTAEWNSALHLPTAARLHSGFRTPHSAIPC